MPSEQRQRHGQPRTRSARCAPVLLRLLPAALAAVMHGTAHASPSATLDQYRAAPRPDDGFALSGGEVGSHLDYSGQLHLDYAREPLVYENVTGRSSTQRLALVRDQLVAHAVLALGLYDRALVYLGLPVNLAMSGTALGLQPTATGFGTGDLSLGGRYSMYRGDVAAVAFQLTLTAPTGEGGANGRPGVAGDRGVTAAPEVTSEIKAGPLSVLIDVGARWRKDAHFSGTRFTDVLTFGAGLSVPIAPQLLRAIAELRGETPLDDVANREGSPLETLLGLKLTAPPGLTFGLGGGFGILRGYGSPQARVVAMIGYDSARKSPKQKSEAALQPSQEQAAQPVEVAPRVQVTKAEAKPGPVVVADRDKDGVADADDHCPILPGPQTNAGCPGGLDYEEHTGELVLLSPPRFEGDPSKPTLIANEGLESLRAAMLASPELRVHVEAHLPHGGDSRKTMDQSVARAAAVRAWLATSGIAEARLEAVGCGSNRPRVPDRGSKRKQNDRVELYLVRPLPPAGMRSSLGCTEVSPPPPPKAPTPPPPKAEPPAQRAPAILPAPVPVPTPAPKSPRRAAGDSDGDSVKDANDACPFAPGPASAKGCPDSHRLDLAAGRIELLKPIRFDEGGAAIAEHSRIVVTEIATTLAANPSMKIAIESHTAVDAGADASLALSRKRAAEVRKQLADQGVAPARLKAYGCGESRPIAPGNVPWGRKKNDRVELHVLDPAPAAGVHSDEGCSPSE